MKWKATWFGRFFVLGAACVSLVPLGANHVNAQALPTISDHTAGLERHDGFLPIYYDRGSGRLFVEIERLSEDLLYVVSLRTGAGWPLDRGSLPVESGPAVVRFEHYGTHLFLVRRNLRFRAGSNEPTLARIIEDSFPASVVGALAIVAEEGGRLLADGTDFFLRDVSNVAGNLRWVDEKHVQLDRERSAIFPPGTMAFPRNTEIEVILTFASDEPGRWIRRRSADARAFTFRQRHSFIKLPPPGFRPRRHDPRIGFYPVEFDNFSGGFDERYTRRWIRRWRLERKNPAAKLSEPVRPVTFYLERGIPETYAEAFRDGILYWNRVFEAAGLRDAIRVDLLPEAADPLDLRYPVVVLWSPDVDPKASMGTFIVDPRTGEILKGVILMDTHRALVDHNTYLALRPALTGGQPDAEEFVQARLRWLMAHEAAHVLMGLLHNSISESQVGFHTPLVHPAENGRLAIDLSEAYATDPLPYDEWAVRYAYTSFPADQEESALAQIVTEGLRQGLRFVSDYPARSIPLANGRRHSDDILEELARQMEVRHTLLEHFGEDVLLPGEPLGLLFERFVPVYFHHQYGLFAAAKALGGVDYTYAVRGDGQVPTHTLEPAEQRQALDLLLTALEPGQLQIPERIAVLIPPPPFGSELQKESEDAESFVFLTGESSAIHIPIAAGGVFEPLGWARALSKMVVGQLLDRQRAARIVSLHALNARNPSFEEVLSRIVEATWDAPVSSPPSPTPLRWVVRRVVLDGLLALGEDEKAMPEVRAVVAGQLEALARRLEAWPIEAPGDRGQVLLAARDIRRFLEGP